jgi:hypothetical protein
VTWSVIGGPFRQELSDLAGEITNAYRFDQIAVKTIAEGPLAILRHRECSLAAKIAVMTSAFLAAAIATAIASL